MRIGRSHFYHHSRFYASLAVGGVVFAAVRASGGQAFVAAAGDAFFLTYLASVMPIMLRHTTEDLKRRAAREDEGMLIVVAVTLAIIAINIGGMFMAINRDSQLDALSFGLVVAGVPLGWFVLHTISAFHYADLHYFDPPGDDEPGKALEFPGGKSPDLWDFLYFSFVIGMTAQVSDVQVCASGMRRAVLGHSIVSFFFNTVLIALVVNAVAASH